MSKRDTVVSCRVGVLRRGAAAVSCALVVVLAGCSVFGGAAVRESSSALGPEDPRLQGDRLTKEQAREELCDHIVGYFPDDMVTDAETSPGEKENFSTCVVDGLHPEPGISVTFEVSSNPLMLWDSLSSFDKELLSDEEICNKLLSNHSGNPAYSKEQEATSYGERPDEYCGIRYADDGHVTAMFIENLSYMHVQMWMEPAESVDSYEVREEIMPYIMEGVKKFHSHR